MRRLSQEPSETPDLSANQGHPDSPALFQDLKGLLWTEIRVPLEDGTGYRAFPDPDTFIRMASTFERNIATATEIRKSRNAARSRQQFSRREDATARNYRHVLGPVPDDKLLAEIGSIAIRLFRAAGFKDNDLELFVFPGTSAQAFVFRPEEGLRPQDRNHGPQQPQSRIIFLSTGLLFTFKNWLEQRADSELSQVLEASKLELGPIVDALKEAYRFPSDSDAIHSILHSIRREDRENVDATLRQWQEASTPTEDDVAFILSHEIRHLFQERRVTDDEFQWIADSKQEEYDADIGGISNILSKAGFNPRNALRVLRFARSMNEISLSHPMGDSRLAESRRLIDDPDTPLSGLDKEAVSIRLREFETVTEHLVNQIHSARSSGTLWSRYIEGATDTPGFLMRAVLLQNMAEIGVAVNSALSDRNVATLGRYLFCLGKSMRNSLVDRDDPRLDMLDRELAESAYDFEREDIDRDRHILSAHDDVLDRRTAAIRNCHRTHFDFPQTDLRLQSWLDSGIEFTEPRVELPDTLCQKIEDGLCYIEGEPNEVELIGQPASPTPQELRLEESADEEQREELWPDDEADSTEDEPDLDWLGIGKGWLLCEDVPPSIRTEISLATSYIAHFLHPEALDYGMGHLKSSIAERYELGASEGRTRWARDFFANLILKRYPSTKSYDLFLPRLKGYDDLVRTVKETICDNLAERIGDQSRRDYVSALACSLAFPDFFPGLLNSSRGLPAPLLPGEGEALLECMPALLVDLAIEDRGPISFYMRDGELRRSHSPRAAWVREIIEKRAGIFPGSLDPEAVERTITRLCADYPKYSSIWARLRVLTGREQPIEVENIESEIRNLECENSDLSAFIDYWRRAVQRGCSEEEKSEIRRAVAEQGRVDSYLVMFFLLESYKDVLFQDDPGRRETLDEMLLDEYPKPRNLLDMRHFLEFMNLLGRDGIGRFFGVAFISQVCDDSSRGAAHLLASHFGWCQQMDFSTDPPRVRQNPSPFDGCSVKAAFSIQFGDFGSAIPWIEADAAEIAEARSALAKYLRRTREVGDRPRFARALAFDEHLALLHLANECKARDPELAGFCVNSVSKATYTPEFSERVMERRIRRFAKDEQWSAEEICSRFPPSKLLCNILLDSTEWRQENLLEVLPFLQEAEDVMEFAQVDDLGLRSAWGTGQFRAFRILSRESAIAGDAYWSSRQEEPPVNEELYAQAERGEASFSIIPYERFRYFTSPRAGVERALLALFNANPVIFLPEKASVERTVQTIVQMAPAGAFRDYLLECALKRGLCGLAGKEFSFRFNSRTEALEQLQGDSALLKESPYFVIIDDESTGLSSEETRKLISQRTDEVFSAVDCVFPLIESAAVKHAIVREVSRELFPEGQSVPLPFVLRYLPEPSVLRDHLLRQYLLYTSLDRDEISEAERLLSSRMLRAGDVSGSSILGLEAMRLTGAYTPVSEKARTLSWLLGIGSAPVKIHEAAVRWGVHFDYTRSSFFDLTSTEIRESLREITLGRRGLFETANAEEKKEMLEFMRTFLDSKLPEDQKEIKEIFLMVFEEFAPERRHAMFSSIIEAMSRNISPSKDEAVVILLESCGPVGVKIGQLLAGVGEVPQGLRDRLKRLRSDVRPFNTIGMAHRLKDAGIEREIASIDRLEGSASMKQVHSGQTADGEEVIIKALRPSIDKYIEEDLRAFGKVSERLSAAGGAWGLPVPPQAMSEIRLQLAEERDLLLEAELANLLRGELDGRRSPGGLSYTVPIIRFASKEVILEDRARGEELSKIGARSDAESKRLYDRLSRELGLEFLRETLTGTYFHADFHDGNVFFDAENSVITLIDPGAVGRVHAKFRQLLKGVLGRVPAHVTDAVLSLSTLRDESDAPLLEDKICTILRSDEPFADRVSRISYEILWHVQPGRDLRLFLKGLAVTAPHLQRLVPSEQEVSRHGITYFLRHIQSLVSLIGPDYRTWASALR